VHVTVYDSSERFMTFRRPWVGVLEIVVRVEIVFSTSLMGS